MDREFELNANKGRNLKAFEVKTDSQWFFKLYYKNVEIGKIAPKMILSSEDWEEATQSPFLVTEDGYELCDKDEQIWFVLFNPQDNNYEMVRASYNAIPEPECKKAFYEKENAEAYIERHKPRYSNADLDSLTERIEIIKGAASDKIEMKAETKVLIHELKNSKND